MGFKLSTRSLSRLQGVHPDLVKVVERAIEITAVDFMVTEGLRTPERQAELLKAGATQTKNSRHLTGHAVDVAAVVDGKVCWSFAPYGKIAQAMKQAAEELGVAIVWGGEWVTLKDGPHFELDRKVYPAEK